MADMRQVLEFVLKADAKNAVKGLRDVATTAGEAQASVEMAGKGWKNSMKSAALAATPWVTGAMAAGAAAIKAADKFKTLALAAGKFADATGMSTEDASRLIEVTGDIGIAAGSVEAAISKMSKALGASDQAFSNLGISIAKTSSGAIDVSATFLNAIDAINSISDPTKRAAAASQVFGKGWRDMAELITMGSEDVLKAMDAVADGKVISEDEVAKAKSYREAMDALGDAMDELALMVGEHLVPALTEAAKKGAELIETLGPLLKVAATGIDLGTKGLMPTKKDAGELGKMVREIEAATKIAMDAVNEVIAATVKPERQLPMMGIFLYRYQQNTALAADALSAAFSVQAEEAMDVAAAEIQAARNAHKLEKAQSQARMEADALRLAWQNLISPLQDEQSWVDLQQQFLDTKDAVEEYNRAQKRGFKTEEERKRAMLDMQEQQLNLKNSVLETAKQLGNIKPEDIKKVLFLVDAGELEAALALMEELEERSRINKQLYFVVGGGDGGSGGGKNSWSGGMVDTQGSFVGERGIEWFQPTAAGRIYTAGELGRAIGASAPTSGGNTYIVNQTLAPGVDAASAGRAVVEAIAAYERMAGKGWRN